MGVTLKKQNKSVNPASNWDVRSDVNVAYVNSALLLFTKTV